MASIRNVFITATAFLSLSAFLVLSAFAIAKGRSQPWHDSCVRFWQKQQWQELKSLAANLDRLGKADPEVLFFGMLAARELQQSNQVEHFASRLLHTRSLNWRMETSTAQHIQPRALTDQIRLYRSRGVLFSFAGIILMNLLLVVQNGRTGIIACMSVLSVAGCILLTI
ncbi:MAG TPA: hypothetical protein VI958_06015 [Acidobacteriota bacterium]